MERTSRLNFEGIGVEAHGVGRMRRDHCEQLAGRQIWPQSGHMLQLTPNAQVRI
jgi:hypothetical protein